MSQLPETTSTKEELLEEIRAEYDRIQVQLRELSSLIEHSQIEVDKLSQRNQSVAMQLRQVEDNFDTLPRSDIKTAYEAAQDARQRLLTMRGQLEKLQSDQNNLEHFSTVLRRVLELVEGTEIIDRGEKKRGRIADPGAAHLIIRIVEAQEGERLRLSQQIHDGPAQSLTNFILQAEICQRLFDRNDPQRASEELGNLRASATGTFQKVREFIEDLRPMMLDDLGLVPTVRRYVSNFQEKTGIAVQLNLSGEERRFESHLEVMMFRGLQELLSNVRDHAAASHVVVGLDLNGDTVTGTVEDNGRGFDPETALDLDSENSKAIGLTTLRERLELVGGTMEIWSEENRGSRIALTLPTSLEDA
ncbi:MAG: sensor histidine kinase [Anaerolineae bacterium]|nr:sensor histidine kinase [Anaerolineae bacterium]